MKAENVQEFVNVSCAMEMNKLYLCYMITHLFFRMKSAFKSSFIVAGVGLPAIAFFWLSSNGYFKSAENKANTNCIISLSCKFIFLWMVYDWNIHHN
jgi:hypothetical protein